MQHSDENLKKLEALLKPCPCGCGRMEKLDHEIINGRIIYACAYTDWHTKPPGDFSRGNYARPIHVSGIVSCLSLLS